MADKKEITEELLGKLSVNREDLYGMLKTLTKLRGDIDKILPEKMDYKAKFVLEERMKTISSLFNTELSIRKQLDDSIKNEINIRSKQDEDDDKQISRSVIDEIRKELENS